MRVFRRVVGFGGGAVVQRGVDVFGRRCMADPLRQQRAGDHAEHADAQSDRLGYQTLFADQHLDQYPRYEAAEDRRQRALRRRALPGAPAKSGTKAPASVTL